MRHATYCAMGVIGMLTGIWFGVSAGGMSVNNLWQSAVAGAVGFAALVFAAWVLDIMATAADKSNRQ